MLPARFLVIIFAVTFLATTGVAAQEQDPEPVPIETPAAQTERPGPAVRESLSEELFVEALVARTRSEVENGLQARQDWYWSIAGGIGALVVAFLTFSGLSQLRDIRSSVREEVLSDLKGELSTSETFIRSVRSGLENQLAATMRTEMEGIQRELDFVRLNYMIVKIKAGNAGFSDAEADAMSAALARLGVDDKYKDNPEFVTSLEGVVDYFFGAGLWHRLLALDDVLRATISRHWGTTSTMLQGYARSLLGEAERADNIVPRFMHYCDAARRLKYPETSSPYLLMYLNWAKPNGWEADVKRLCQDVEHLTEGERSEFLRLLRTASIPTLLAKNVDAEIIRMAEKAQAVLEVKRDFIARLEKSLRSPEAIARAKVEAPSLTPVASA